MWHRGYFIYYHQDIWGGVYAIYSKPNAHAPFHLAINHFYSKDACIKYIDECLIGR